ncbi:MAG: sigma-54-dependent Fis family transcriptional regulator, partial [Myxococcales bacterium]|nr:sigma-54-dependent Fis family transcriptional regulator [Myxococcales bacterium]
DLCARVVDEHPQLPVVVLTGQQTMEAAIGALRAGASDFVTKPVDFVELQHRIERALRQRDLELEVRRLRQEATRPPGAINMIGESAVMRGVFERVARVATSDVRVLISGESGVGKELVARAIHEQSPRADGPFVALNCAAVPTNLLESELFGHARGAFTDARRARDGLFLQAQGGTLLLDEIGEMPAAMQPKLLRALQERTIRPVGGDRHVRYDARIITATNRDLEAEVAHGRFREDLYYRINVVGISVPPLRARDADISLLAEHFLQRCAARSGAPRKRLSPAAASRLRSYEWPGNVRELENTIERAVALSVGDAIEIDDLPDRLRAPRPSNFVISAEDPSEFISLQELERRYLQRVLTLVRGNKTRAAAILGLARRTLYRKLDRIAAAPQADE